MTLVRIVKDWDWPDLMRQTPGEKGVWDGIEYSLEPIYECDFLVMLNNRMKTDTLLKCPSENIWALMQEPYMKGFTDWMVEKHECFSKVLTHHSPSDDEKYVPSHPAIPWHINKTFDQLISAQVPEKSRNLSWIVGDAMDLPGHFKRWSFLECLRRDAFLDLDLYGKAINFIEDKWDGLAPYRYSLAIENNSGPYCWTEKLADCFLTWTVPIYYGCTNLASYFPEESYVQIDINKPQDSLEKIKRIINENSWDRRFSAMTEARELVLYHYQLFPYLSKLIQSQPAPKGDKTAITIPAYKRSKKTALYYIGYKFKKMTFYQIKRRLLHG